MTNGQQDGLLQRLRFEVNCAILYAKENAPELPEFTEPKTLAQMQDECADKIKEDMAERLDVDKDIFDDVNAFQNNDWN